MPDPWPYAARMAGILSSTLHDMFKRTADTDLISFAGGFPAAEFFPVAEVRAACAEVLTEDGPDALQYSTLEGYRPLVQWILADLAANAPAIGPEQLLITNGSQQAMDLLGKLFLNPGDLVAMDNPGYLGAMQAFAAYQARFVPLETDEQGTIPDSLEAQLQALPIRLIYLTPNFQNPLGVTLSAERRRHIALLAERYGVALVEDDAYGRLRYSGQPLPPVRAFSDRVISLGSFSKFLVPGFRLGWVAAPQAVIAKLILLKQGADLHTSTFAQRVVATCLRKGFLPDHLRRLLPAYAQRRDAMLAALAQHMGDLAEWTRPEGGLFIWLRLRDPVDADALLDRCLARGVAFVPGAPFYVASPEPGTLRLNFSCSPPDRIAQGIATIATVLRSKEVCP